MVAEQHQTTTIDSRRRAWIALAALLGHLLLMATPLHEAWRHGNAGHGGDISRHAEVAAPGRAGSMAEWGRLPDAGRPADCALQPAPASGRQPVVGLGAPLALPVASSAPVEAGAAARAAARHPPWPGDPQALLQVFRL